MVASCVVVAHRQFWSQHGFSRHGNALCVLWRMRQQSLLWRWSLEGRKKYQPFGGRGNTPPPPSFLDYSSGFRGVCPSLSCGGVRSECLAGSPVSDPRCLQFVYAMYVHTFRAAVGFSLVGSNSARFRSRRTCDSIVLLPCPRRRRPHPPPPPSNGCLVRRPEERRRFFV